MTNRTFTYETSCVQSDALSIRAMVENAREISLKTLRRKVDVQKWAPNHGYAVGGQRGLHLKDDYHVRYYRSRYRGRRCYYIEHSAIDYVFTQERDRL